jgi:hypothetical protein
MSAAWVQKRSDTMRGDLDAVRREAHGITTGLLSVREARSVGLGLENPLADPDASEMMRAHERQELARSTLEQLSAVRDAQAATSQRAEASTAALTERCAELERTAALRQDNTGLHQSRVDARLDAIAAMHGGSVVRLLQWQSVAEKRLADTHQSVTALDGSLRESVQHLTGDMSGQRTTLVGHAEALGVLQVSVTALLEAERQAKADRTRAEERAQEWRRQQQERIRSDSERLSDALVAAESRAAAAAKTYARVVQGQQAAAARAAASAAQLEDVRSELSRLSCDIEAAQRALEEASARAAQIEERVARTEKKGADADACLSTLSTSQLDLTAQLDLLFEVLGAAGLPSASQLERWSRMTAERKALPAPPT